MTREEAIEILKGAIKKPNTKDGYLGQALDMAIKALEQEPCDDAISRQAVLDAMSDTWKHICSVARRRKPTKGEEAVYSDMVGTVKSMSSVTPQPKTGHWEWVQYDYNPKLGNWHCSECRCIVVECVDKEEKGGIPLYKYCPQCGAKMQEAEIEG